MKIFFIFLMVLSVLNVQADEVEKLRIKDIKNHLETVNPDSTCMDEYLKRRNQLIVKLTLAPASIVVGTVASTYTGALAAGLLAKPFSVTGWDALGWIILGGLGGGLAGGAYTATDTIMAGVTLYRHTLVVKTVAEYQINRGEYYSNKLYEEYSIQSSKDQKLPLPKDLFVKELVELDAAGTLCDGSLVKQPRIKLGPKLKFKVAKSKNIFQEINAAKR
jgi:hypothetical protein